MAMGYFSLRQNKFVILVYSHYCSAVSYCSLLRDKWEPVMNPIPLRVCCLRISQSHTSKKNTSCRNSHAQSQSLLSIVWIKHTWFVGVVHPHKSLSYMSYYMMKLTGDTFDKSVYIYRLIQNTFEISRHCGTGHDYLYSWYPGRLSL